MAIVSGPVPDERLYSITQAAEWLKVSPATIATWIRLGIAKASRQDELGRYRYTEQDLIDMRERFQQRQARTRAGSSGGEHAP